MITNKYNLPDAIVKLVEGDNYEYKKNRYSVTELLNSTKEIILRRRYGDRITEDVSDHINMLFGTAFHKLFETDEVGSELKVEVAVSDSVLSGRIDNYDRYTVIDYKTAGVWKVKKEDFSDWEKQVLIYSWVLTKLGNYVAYGKIIAFLKDFSKSRKEFDSEYPEAQIYVHNFKISTQMFEETEKFILNKIKEIEFYIDAPNKDLPEPTDDELWKIPDKYAVMKRSSSRAMKVCDNINEAQLYMIEKKADYIEVRKGAYKKLEYDKGLEQLFEICKTEEWNNGI